MIEYVKRNGNKFVLPKNIRQVGDMDLDKRVYIEDYVYSFIKELTPDEDDEGRVGVLLGEEKQFGADTYVFVRGAMEVINASVYDGRIAFTEETWHAINANKSLYFNSMNIVGWFLVSEAIKPDNNASVERTHIDSIGKHKLFMYVNPAELIEDVYSCFDGGLEQLDGYAVYFEKNDEMQAYMAAVYQERKRTHNDDIVIRKYRQLLKENNYEPKARKQLSLMYAVSTILVILVLVIGVGKLQAVQTPEVIETTPEDTANYVESGVDVNATVAPIEDATLNIDFVEGDVTAEATTEELESSASEETTEAVSETETEPVTEAATEEPQTETTTEATTEAATHRTYVVKSGDTLYDILIREYGNLDNLQALFDLNGITDGGNSIDVGDELLLP